MILVPNFDITKPKLMHLSSHGRKRRSSKDVTTEEKYNEIYHDKVVQAPKKQIQLQGFGRQFSLNIHPNEKLLDPFFVHLHRHENRSEILPHELVRKQLGCFYHGSATHQGSDENDVEQGAVALSLCGGMVRTDIIFCILLFFRYLLNCSKPQ